MKKSVIMVCLALGAASAFGAETNSTPQYAEAKYTAAIENRTAEILKVLALTDAVRSVGVHDAIIAQYHSLKAWHDEYDGKLNSKPNSNTVALIGLSRKSLHDHFLAQLAENLTPAQIEQVKDKMTYGKVQFTFNGYVSQYPNLTDAHRQKILELLKQAREEAMDGGSAAEKTAVFKKYKGKINNYLAQEGIHAERTKVISATNSPAQ